LAGICRSQETQTPPVVSAAFDPSDVYFQGYLASRDAEMLEAQGDSVGALRKLERAKEMFDVVRRYHPEWKERMVSGRHAKTEEAIKRVRPMADEQLRKQREVVAELEGAPVRSGVQEQTTNPLPGVLQQDPIGARRLKEAEAEVARLRAESAQSKEAGRKQQAAGADLERRHAELQAQLQAAEQSVRNMRSKLSAAPVESEMLSLNQRIASLEQERGAMALALEQSRSAHTESMARLATLEADLSQMRQQRSDLERDLQAERQVSNQVVAGLRRQLKELETELEKRNGELSAARNQIRSLTEELVQSRDAYTQLQGERDALLLERDQMAALLKLNEQGRIQQLIEQNLSVAKDLREAKERVESLQAQGDADKDAITDALRDLAIAKTQINGLQREKRDQDKRFAELEERLKREEESLAQTETSADPAETEMLREIVRRQLRVQERRRQARDLLVEAARALGAQDPNLADAISLFDGQEVELTPEEMKLIADRQVDGEFVSPFARDRGSVARSMEHLNRDITVFERTAEKSYLGGRLLPARELYQMILDQNPGHSPSWCRLGVVHLKLDDPGSASETFRRAVELDPGNPYAHRMLGYSLMRLGDLKGAESALRKSVDQSPNDARSRMLLATLCYRTGRVREAESQLKAAISADPMSGDSYYNLALICSREGRIADAREFYKQALELGALPDPKLEEAMSRP
jgi:predicted  nucleic acid-binding Zn-ribbon protein